MILLKCTIITASNNSQIIHRTWTGFLCLYGRACSLIMFVCFHLCLWTLVTLRTNGAIIKGFEQDVGFRTTHYTFSTNTLMNSMRSYAGAGYRGPPQSEVRTGKTNVFPHKMLKSWPRRIRTHPHSASVRQETRYVFLPDHDRDYLLMKAAATHTPVERGPERAKE